MSISKMQFYLLVEKVNEVIKEGTVNADWENETITVENSDYFSGDRDELNEAWVDFKDTNKKLREAGIYTIFDQNEIPDFDFIEWTLYIDVKKSIYLTL